ncbi:MAG: cytochrome c [Acidimicrobiia bacterium]
MSFRTTLILINLFAVGGLLIFIGYRVVSLRRNPEPRQPENLTPFFDDDVLEGPHLERVLGVALVALVISVVALIGYFLWEPFRAADATEAFKERSIARGELLFAGPASPAFDSAKSQNCARCHGNNAEGGSAKQVIKSTDPRCSLEQKVNEKLEESQPYCLPQQVDWAAPNLTLAPLRYSRAQLTQIITYGRPGTPMPAWGFKSGKGALNEQSIQDLVNYVDSISTTPDKAQTGAVKDAEAMRKTLDDPEVQGAADKWVADSAAGLAQAQAALDALPADATDSQRSTAEGRVELATEQARVAAAWQETTRNATDGQVLFMNNCARCHTRGWTYFNPLDPQGNPAPGPMGGGAYGPNLRDGDVSRQFPSPLYDADYFGWISAGVPAFESYGVRGISSGRMPHFGAVLTKAQIEAIMEYERNL